MTWTKYNNICKGGHVQVYDPKKHHRCASNYSLAYTYIRNSNVILSVCQFGIDNLVPRTDGDGKVFRSIDMAREFAFKKGYLVEYDPKEELEKSLALKMKIDQKTLNKTRTENV